MSLRILVADDDARVRNGLVAVVQALGHRTLEAATGREAIAVSERERPDMVLLDLQMPDGTGLEVLPDLVRDADAPSVVMVTGVAEVSTAVAAMRAGAADFLEKPVRLEVLQGVLERVSRGRAVARERDLLRDEVARLRSGPIVGESRGIHRVHDQIDRVASTPRTTVLITGESGVGKELVARAIHERSDRASGPFVALNCAALADSMLEAELFGYEAGAFTGALPKGREGLFAAAEGGTLFLDEIGELAPELQAKLLRVLQERSFRRVGGHEDHSTDVRILASTNRDLAAMVETGRFREDLYYRLNVLSIVVPPLRERREDIAHLARHFLAHFATEFGRDYAGFDESALSELTARPWPGNIRELRNAVERAALNAGGGLVRGEHVEAGEARVMANTQAADSTDPSATYQLGLESLDWRAAEEVLVRRALDVAAGNRSETARLLGVNRATLYNKLKAFGI